MSNPRNAFTSLLHRLGVAGPARVRAFQGTSAPKITQGSGAGGRVLHLRGLILAPFLTALYLICFAPGTALARTVHVFSSSFTGSGVSALSEPVGVAVNDETVVRRSLLEKMA